MSVQIVAVTMTQFEYPLKRRRGGAHGPSGRTHQNGLLVKVACSTGHTGIAVANPSCASSPNRVDAGWTVLGEEPGIGLFVSREKLADCAIDRLSPRAGYGWTEWRPGASLVEMPATAEGKRIGAQPGPASSEGIRA